MSALYNGQTTSVNHATEQPSPEDSAQLQVDNKVTSKSSTSGVSNATAERGKTRITCPVTVVNGLDFLKASFWIEWESFDLLDQLERLKECVQSTEDESIPVDLSKGFKWNLHRTGTSRYNYRLTSGDITLLLNRRRCDGVVPTAKLEIGSLSCWSPGFYYLYERMLRWIKAFGGDIKKETVSEVHLTADCIGVDINSLEIEVEDRWVSRVHLFNTHHYRRKLSGISMGKGDIMLRIYDKVLELVNSPHKQDIFSEIWGQPHYQFLPVTRVEFQLRRTILNQFGGKIQTVKDLLFSLKALWAYCTVQWARFASSAVNRNHNQSKAKNSEFWDLITNVTWSGLHLIERKQRQPNKDLDHLRKNIRGMLMTACCFFGPHPEDLDHIIGISKTLIEQDFTKYYEEDLHAFTQKMKRKANEVYVNI